MFRFFPLIVITSSLVMFTSCRSAESPTEQIEQTVNLDQLRSQGDSISLLAQQTLLVNVSRGLQTEGAPRTIEICRVNASALLDSLSKANGVHISRISDRNRNPNNAASKEEKSILERFAKGATDTVVSSGNQHIYYKAIRIGMPGCLLCHGVPEKDILPQTMDKIHALYPTDKATGYHSDELRGAWKIVYLE